MRQKYTWIPQVTTSQVTPPRRSARSRRRAAGHPPPRRRPPAAAPQATRRLAACHCADHQQVTAPPRRRSRRRPPAGHGADHQQVTAPPLHRPPARGGPTIYDCVVWPGEPSYIVGPPLAGGLWSGVAWRAIVYSRATPCGWPARGGGWPVERRWVACGARRRDLRSGVEWLICGGTGTWLRN